MVGVVPGEPLPHDRIPPRAAVGVLIRRDREIGIRGRERRRCCHRRQEGRGQREDQRRAAKALEAGVGGRVSEFQFDIPPLVADPGVEVGDEAEDRDQRRDGPEGDLPVPGEDRPADSPIGLWCVKHIRQRPARPQARQLVKRQGTQEPSHHEDHRVEHQGKHDPLEVAPGQRQTAPPHAGRRPLLEENDGIDEKQGDKQQREGDDQQQRQPAEECLVEQQRKQRCQKPAGDAAPVSPFEPLRKHRPAKKQRQRCHRPRRLEGQQERPADNHVFRDHRPDDRDIDPGDRSGPEEDGQCDPGAATDGEQAGKIEAFEESPWPDGDPQLVRRHRAPPSRIDSAPRTGEGGDRRRGWRPSPRPPPPWCGRGASRGRQIPQ